MNGKYRAFEGANGWYVAFEREDGTHKQPSYYRPLERDAAEREAAALNNAEHSDALGRARRGS